MLLITFFSALLGLLCHQNGVPGMNLPKPTIVHATNSHELRQALLSAVPGTQILLAPGEYEGDLYINDLAGTAEQPILIAGADPANPPVIQGRKECLHLSQIRYVTVRNLILQNASGNGLNVDDGGQLNNPSHHVVLEKLTVRDIGPKGNRDGIKLSGLAKFEVRDCTVERWGSDGSGIDMVGCRQGRIVGSTFRHGDDVGSNSIQMKGGSRDIVVRECRFEHGGQRAINIGGSTGMAYFRPEPQGYEAKNITVERCEFIGSNAAIAFVGVDGARVRFNKIVRPKRWVLRILQETRDPEFVACRNGQFTDNHITYRSDEIRTVVNVGPGTSPETFRFCRNTWHCVDQPDSGPPQLPTPESDDALCAEENHEGEF